MATQTAVCGIYDCTTCEHMSKGICPGCREANQRLLKSGEPVCAVFECVYRRAIAGCANCEEARCILKRSVESVCPMRSRFENTRWWAGRMARALETRKGAGSNSKKQEVSEKVINRLRWYLTALDGFAEEGATSISSWRLAERVGVNAALIRKDLSRFGDFGTPSLGYEVAYLVQRLRDILRLDHRHKVLWIGAASLRFHTGSLIRLGNHFCGITTVLDADPHEVGQSVCDINVEPLDKLEQVLAANDIHTATIAVTGAQAFDIAERLADSGIKSILNLSGEILPLPDTVRVTNLDLVGELLELCYYSAP